MDPDSWKSTENISWKPFFKFDVLCCASSIRRLGAVKMPKMAGYLDL